MEIRYGHCRLCHARWPSLMKGELSVLDVRRYPNRGTAVATCRGCGSKYEWFYERPSKNHVPDSEVPAETDMYRCTIHKPDDFDPYEEMVLVRPFRHRWDEGAP